ncbi:MAG: endonuclease/exonuclease/phosphatase family protein [bacterium]|nr:endonuclease/exonuclease/phosphatase family protein [bacterium]
MKVKGFLLVFVFFVLFQSQQAQIKFCSWNLENFGRSKSDSTITFIAGTLTNFDLVAVVEVVAGNGGAQAVARLADELNRKGSKWDYCISDPTQSYPGSTERYAFLWKTSKLKKLGDARLDTNYRVEIEREPYLANFSENNKEFMVAALHAVPKSKQPEREIKYLRFIPAHYPGKTILFCGDFNCPQSHSVFGPLKAMNYKPALINQKTSLKNECQGTNCLASEYDNVFYDSTRVTLKSSGVIEFYKSFATLKIARKISDHLPVFVEFDIK